MDLPSPSPAASAPAASAPAAPLTSRTLVNVERFLARLLVGTGLLIALFVLIFLAAFSLEELTSRQNTLRDVNDQMAKIQAELARSVTADDTPALRSREQAGAQLAALERAARDVQSLMSGGGANSEEELRFIRARLAGRKVSRGLLPYPVVRSVRLLNNDALLVILLTVCGAIGTAVAAARRKTHITMYSVALGMAAGFVTFLAINGGKEVFLQGPTGSSVTFNPYSSGFFALMAGLFTEKAYALLTSLIDSFSKKLEKTVQE